MWRDVFLTNRDAVLEMLGRFLEDLSQLQRAVRVGDGPGMQELFTRTRARAPLDHHGRAGDGGAGLRPPAWQDRIARWCSRRGYAGRGGRLLASPGARARGRRDRRGDCFQGRPSLVAALKRADFVCEPHPALRPPSPRKAGGEIQNSAGSSMNTKVSSFTWPSAMVRLLAKVPSGCGAPRSMARDMARDDLGEAVEDGLGAVVELALGEAAARQAEFAVDIEGFFGARLVAGELLRS